MDSEDEALCEMLGFKSLYILQSEDLWGDEVKDESMKTNVRSLLQIPTWDLDEITQLLQTDQTIQEFDRDSICILPLSLSISPWLMRRITDDLTWDRKTMDIYPSDKTYESIQVVRNGNVEKHQELTRIENFVNTHSLWNGLCHKYLRNCVSALMGEEMVLYKEKLNLKPPYGSGFAPHLDSPSLRVPFGSTGPRTFITVMVAIDDMSIENGCLRVVKGRWSEENHCEVIEGQEDGNPDAEGRAGAIPSHISELQLYEDIPLKGGSIAMFNGWTPHRSTSNNTNFSRRAVFLTYNPLREGNFHDLYYVRMKQKRNNWISRCSDVISSVRHF